VVPSLVLSENDVSCLTTDMFRRWIIFLSLYLLRMSIGMPSSWSRHKAPAASKSPALLAVMVVVVVRWRTIKSLNKKQVTFLPFSPLRTPSRTNRRYERTNCYTFSGVREHQHRTVWFRAARGASTNL